MVGKATSTIATQISAASIALGGSATDTATVTGLGSGFPIPTGPVTFQVSTNGGKTFKDYGAVKTLSNGTATSDSYTPTVAGTYYFRAVYSCDSNYNESQSGDKDEPLTVINSIPTPVIGNTAGTVASNPTSSGDKNQYNLYIKITSTSVSGLTVGQMVWCAASTTDFPNLLTLGATLTGTMDHSSGWWTFKKTK